MGNVLRYSLSAGVLTVAFGVLGAVSAQAKPIAVEADGKAPPKPNANVAGLLPGGGALVRAADSAKKVVAKANAAQPKQVVKGKEKEQPKSGKSNDRDSGGHDDSPKGKGKPVSPESARSIMAAIPGPAGVVAKASNEAEKRMSGQRAAGTKAKGSLPDSGFGAVLGSVLDAKPEPEPDPLFTMPQPKAAPRPAPMPRGADSDRKSPVRYEDMAHGQVVDRGEEGRGLYEEDYGDGVTKITDLRTGVVSVNGYKLLPGSPPVSKIIPVLKESMRSKQSSCPTPGGVCGDPVSERTADTANRLQDACSGTFFGANKLDCSDDFSLGLVVTAIKKEQPPAGYGAGRLMAAGMEAGGFSSAGDMVPIMPGGMGGARVSPGRSGAAGHGAVPGVAGRTSAGKGKASANTEGPEEPRNRAASPEGARDQAKTSATGAEVPTSSPNTTAPARGGTRGAAAQRSAGKPKKAKGATSSEEPSSAKTTKPKRTGRSTGQGKPKVNNVVATTKVTQVPTLPPKVSLRHVEVEGGKYPESAGHITDNLTPNRKGKFRYPCTVDRGGANGRRAKSLRGIATRTEKDRDEWPQAVCAEGGEGASVRHIGQSDNRGSGSTLGHQLNGTKEGYERIPEGTRVLVFVKP